MLAPDTLPYVAIGISAVSLLISFVGAMYARAGHRKRIADEMPIFWATAKTGEMGWTVTIHVRNRSTADMECQEIAVRRPAGVLITRRYAAIKYEQGRAAFDADLSRQLAAKSSGMNLSARRAGSETQRSPGGMIYSPGDTSSEEFTVHRPPPSRWRSKATINLSMRVMWSLKDAASRRRVEQVNITLPAATNEPAAASSIAI